MMHWRALDNKFIILKHRISTYKNIDCSIVSMYSEKNMDFRGHFLMDLVIMVTEKCKFLFVVGSKHVYTQFVFF